MRITNILVLASLGALIAVGLYVLATRGRGQRATLSDQKKQLAESEAQPTLQPELSTQTRELRPVPHEPRARSVNVETNTESGLEESHPAQQPKPAPQAINIGLVQSGEAKALEAPSLTTETVNSQEKESYVEVSFTQEGEHLPTRDTLEAEAGAVGVTDTPGTGVAINEQSQTGLDESLHCSDDQLPHQAGRVSPEKRGGRSRAAAQEGEREKAIRSRWRLQKPEIVCWKRTWEWILAVELPEVLQEARGISVSQNSVDLAEDELEKGYWRLAELRGEVVVQAVENGDVSEVKSALGEDGRLLFKLSGAGLNRGRSVKQPFSGSYLAIVPEDWERCKELAGTAPATPEPVCLEGFRAHFFDLPANSATNIAFLDSTGRSIVLGSIGPRFELVGQEVRDASENLGLLFGGRTPSLSMMDGSWKDVGIIVLGEEGGGRGRWRTNFKPNLALHEQQVPDEVASRKTGWYFVRFYNLENELIDSLDFRFAAGLRGITIQKSNVVPSLTGHEETTVEFQHDANWYVTRSCASPGEVNIERADEKTILTIPPMQDSDRTQWLLGLRGGPQIDVSILVERIWWATSEENIPPGQWTDKQLIVTREELRATSSIALWLHLPKQRWSHSVLVGFSRATAKPYPVLVTENTVAISLRNFGDAPEMDTIGEFSLRLWVTHDETTYETCVCKLVVRAGCAFCDFSATAEEAVLQHVKAHHLHELARALTWEEHRQRMPGLPLEIYRCGYDSFYVRADDSPHPDDAIIRHIRDVHATAVGHPVQIRFSIVHDTEEIRQNVIGHLPRIHRCNFCDREFEDFDEADLWRHLVDNHKRRLLDPR